jgi:hypothetical protein
MKVKFREYSKKEYADRGMDPCGKCVKRNEETNIVNCCKANKCQSGYYVRDRQSKSSDRRLLEALLKCLDLSEDGVFSGKLVNISAGNQLKLLAIKKAIQKGSSK